MISPAVITEIRDQTERRLDIWGVVTLSAGMLLMVLALLKSHTWGWLATKTDGVGTVGAGLAGLVGLAGLAVLAIFVVIELRTSHPLLPMRLFKDRKLSIGTLAVVINFMGLFAAVFFVSLYMQNVQGFAPVEAGLRALPMSLSIMIAAPLSGVLTKRFGPRPAAVVGLGFVGGALFLMSFLKEDSAYSMQWPAFALLGIGVGLATTACSDAIISATPLSDAGIACGLQGAARQLGSILAITVGGSILSGRVASVLDADLTRAGTPQAVADKLIAAQDIVATGAVPTTPGMPVALSRSVIDGSHQAFISGLHSVMLVICAIALAGCVIAVMLGGRERLDEGAEELIRYASRNPP